MATLSVSMCGSTAGTQTADANTTQARTPLCETDSVRFSTKSPLLRIADDLVTLLPRTSHGRGHFDEIVERVNDTLLRKLSKA